MGHKKWRHLLAIICAAYVWAVFPQTASATPPTIESQWITDLSSSDATLNARINPNGLPTVYKLQIDTTGNFNFSQTDSCPLHPPGVVCAQELAGGEPLPAGLVEPPEMALSSPTESQDVSVVLSSIGAVLQPETTYHFRAIAANDLDFIYGPDLTFTTPPPSEPPPSEEEEPEGEESPEEEEPPKEEPSDEEEPPADQTPSGTAEGPTGSEPLAPPFSLSFPASSDTSKSMNRRKKHRKQRRVGARVAVHQARAIR